MTKVTIISQTDCDHCDEVREILKDMVNDFPDLQIEDIDAISKDGQQMIITHGIMKSPGILVNDEFFAMGNITQAELRNKLNEYNR